MARTKKLQMYRGNKSDLPLLAAGEPAYALDTKELFIGDGSSNNKVGGGDKSTTTPKVAGTAAIGTETAYAAGAHVHPAQKQLPAYATLAVATSDIANIPTNSICFVL